jgi:hypothetical protein
MWALRKVGGHDAKPMHGAHIMREASLKGARDPGSPKAGSVHGELGSWAGSALGATDTESFASNLRYPTEGDPVQIFGLHGRAELNGLRARVSCSGYDASGKVSIRISDIRGSRKMLIRAANLHPLVAAAKALPAAGLVRIGSTPALSAKSSACSAESCAPSRASGSVFSASAQSALRNTGRLARTPLLLSVPPTPVP